MKTPSIIAQGTPAATLQTNAGRAATYLTDAREALSRTAPQRRDFYTDAEHEEAIAAWAALDRQLRVIEDRAHEHYENVKRAVKQAGGLQATRENGRQHVSAAHP